MGDTPAASSVPAGTNAKVSPAPSASAAAGGTAAAAAAAGAEGNPVFRMMGLPNFKAKLPSRNWLIFFAITGSFGAAVYYDKREQKRIQKKWCDLVAPLAEQTLPVNMLPRRMTVYIEAPPGDGLRPAREHFHTYVKPVLVAAAVDWEAVEGRREGDVRYATAEKIRKYRVKRGESVAEAQQEEELDAKAAVEEMREKVGTEKHPGPAGDLVIGRNTWKEYIRGLHEGWLGPVVKPEAEFERPSAHVEETEERKHVPAPPSVGDAAVQAAADTVTPSAAPVDDASPAAPTASTEFAPEKTEPEAEKPKPKNVKPEPYISTSAYPSAVLPSSFPAELGPSGPIPLPHILGFWNFPYRIHRFLNRRYLADDIGRRTAAAVLASSRPFSQSADAEGRRDNFDVEGGKPAWEQEGLFTQEQAEWHKSIRKRERKEGEESVWLDDIVIDERIGSRMQKFELTADDEQRAEQLYNEPRSDKD